MSTTKVKKALISGAKDFLTGNATIYVAGEGVLSGFPVLDASDIGWENRLFEPAGNEPWASVFYRPNVPALRTIGPRGYDQITGFLQIDINIVPSKGSKTLTDWEDKARAYFHPGRFFIYDGQAAIITSCGMSAGRHVENFYRGSLTIAFRAQIKRLSRGWAPSDLGEFAVSWFDASDLTTIDETGGAVTWWYDKMVSNRNLRQDNALYKPSSGVDTLNGLNVITAPTGTSLFANFVPDAFQWPVSGKVSVYIVMDFESYTTTAPPVCWSFSDTLTSRNDIDGQNLGVGTDFNIRMGNNVLAGIPYNEPMILCMEHNGANLAGYINGSNKLSVVDVAPTVGNDTAFLLNQSNNGVRLMSAKYAEIVIIKDDVTQSTRQILEGYLAHKWGLQTNLENSHPFKVSPPVVSPSNN